MIDHGTKCNAQPCTCNQFDKGGYLKPAAAATVDYYCCIEYYRSGTTHRQGCTVRRLSDVAHEYLIEQQEQHGQQADYPPMPLDCPLYCTKHNHEEMGG